MPLLPRRMSLALTALSGELLCARSINEFCCLFESFAPLLLLLLTLIDLRTSVPGVGVVLDTVLDGSPKSRRITLLRFCCGCGCGCGCGCCSLPKSKRRLGDGEARGLGGRGGGVEEEEVSKGTAAAVLFDGV